MSPLHFIPELCWQHGISHAVICAGSRSAPLTIAFARHGKIHCKILADERSAGYMALGMAQISSKGVVLICTSGTAALNFAPAVAEAFYQKIPLLILTADRPPEWIGQGDGQTIDQRNIYGYNVKKFFSFPADKNHPDISWAIERMLNEAIHLTSSPSCGPVHINIPLREPLYPDVNEATAIVKVQKVNFFAPPHTFPKETWDEVVRLLLSHKKKLIVAGHYLPSSEFKILMQSFMEANQIPMIADINSNLQEVDGAILFSDAILNMSSPEMIDELCPDLMLSFGCDFISKNLKLFLRKHKPIVHINISEDVELIDTFQSITHKITMSPFYFFKELINRSKINTDIQYLKTWQTKDKIVATAIPDFFAREGFNEFGALALILPQIPAGSVLHLGNSLAVRYLNHLSSTRTVNYSNRGTSGIDGCISTAVGAALLIDQFVTLVVGDVSFFYDINGLCHAYLPSNLRIIVLNNHGGGIFRNLPGANHQPEIDEFFVTSQPRTCGAICAELEIDYNAVSSYPELDTSVKKFYKSSDKPKLIEIDSDTKISADILTKYKSFHKYPPGEL